MFHFHFHKHNLRHLPRFPDFFVTFRIFSPSSGLLVHFRFSARRLQQLQERRWDKRRKLAKRSTSQVLPAVTNDFLFRLLAFKPAYSSHEKITRNPQHLVPGSSGIHPSLGLICRLASSCKLKVIPKRSCRGIHHQEMRKSLEGY